MNRDQEQTRDSFGYKWARTDSWGSPGMRAQATGWLLNRYGFPSVDEMAEYYSRGTFLDLGCGAGFTASLWLEHYTGPRYLGVDISGDAIAVARERLGHLRSVEFLVADLMHLPDIGKFDAVFSEGVLHHTPNTKDALAVAAGLVRPGGELLFYVYAKKAPIREFADDYIREQIADLPLEDAWREMEAITELGRVLSDDKQQVEIPAVPVLGIKASTQTIQRFVYWNIAKVFWNETMTFEENVHLNFDWYRPKYAWRQTAGEVDAWLTDLGLSAWTLNEDEAGITVRARAS